MPPNPAVPRAGFANVIIKTIEFYKRCGEVGYYGIGNEGIARADKLWNECQNKSDIEVYLHLQKIIPEYTNSKFLRMMLIKATHHFGPQELFSSKLYKALRQFVNQLKPQASNTPMVTEINGFLMHLSATMWDCVEANVKIIKVA